MSRQEVYAWASLLSNLAFLLVYLAFVVGIPAFLSSYQENLTTILLWIIFVDLVFQAVISLQQSSSVRVEKDERDERIEAKGFRIGYYVFMVAIVILIGHLFMQGMIESFADPVYLERVKMLPLHFLVAMLVAGTSAKSVVQIRMYRSHG
jgi:hypothetical protein